MSASKSCPSFYSADWDRSITNAPKPNTRFLRNIIKETDSHNSALRAKEAQDAKSRLHRLHVKGSEIPKRTHRPEDLKDHHSKRRRLDHRTGSLVEHSSGSSRRDSRRHADYEEDTRSKRHQKDYQRSDEEQHGRGERHHHNHHRHTRRSPSRSRSEEVDLRDYRDRSSRSKKRSDPHKDSRDHDHKRRRRRRRSASTSASEAKPPPKLGKGVMGEGKRSSRKEASTESPQKTEQFQQSDSDPLESIVGPLPPLPPSKIQARGRGKFASSSVMDTHFSSKYDPSQDIHPNSDSENDWDQALEALRDRQRWKRQGADRLRSAGFTEEQVGKWEKGDVKGEEDVRWNGKGEGREWDRGKVMGKDGVEVRPEWGRLKGT